MRVIENASFPKAKLDQRYRSCWFEYCAENTYICRYGLSFEKSTCFQCEIMIFMKNESLSVVNDQVWTNKTRCLMQTNERNKNRRQIRRCRCYLWYNRTCMNEPKTIMDEHMQFYRCFKFGRSLCHALCYRYLMTIFNCGFLQLIIRAWCFLCVLNRDNIQVLLYQFDNLSFDIMDI